MVPVRGGFGGPLSLSVPSGHDGCFKGRRSKPEQEEEITTKRVSAKYFKGIRQLFFFFLLFVSLLSSRQEDRIPFFLLCVQ